MQQLACSLGVVQIHKLETSFGAGLFDGTSGWWNTHGWRLDKGIPYPYFAGENTINNPALFKSRALFVDQPGGIAPQHWLAGTLVHLKHRFEAHVVALSGPEKGAVYGGFEWGYEFSIMSEYAGLIGAGYIDAKPEHYDFTYSISPMTIPSKTFQDVVRMHGIP